MKIAIFDFCDTLVSFQTANAFVEFVCMQKRFSLRNVFLYLYKFLKITKVISIICFVFNKESLDKRIPLLLLRGIYLSDLEHYAIAFYNEKIKPSTIDIVLEELINKQRNTYKTAIVSGGYEIYIKYFAIEFGIDIVIANNINFKNNKCVGTFGKDCMGLQKVREIEKNQLCNEIDFPSSFFYSDSITDLPLLKHVGNPVVVSKKQHQKWIDLHSITNEIIWKNEK